MYQFSVPADFDSSTIDRYALLNQTSPGARVTATYGNISQGNPFASGREIAGLPAVDLDGLTQYVAHAKRHGIEFYYTLNASCWHNWEFTPDGVGALRMWLGGLLDAGVETLIVSLPSVMEIVQRIEPRFSIKASVICQVSNANRARLLKDMGAQGIVVDESVIRDFGALRRIREAFGDNVEVIANSICYVDCQYRMFHYNQVAADSVTTVNPYSGGYYASKCWMRICQNIETVLKLAWIRPEDLRHYADLGITRYKIQGRTMVKKGDPVRTVEAYMKQHFEGNLVDLLMVFAPAPAPLRIDNRALDDFLRPFVEREGFCRHDCQHCGYCAGYIKRHLPYEQIQAEMQYHRERLSEANRLEELLAQPPQPDARTLSSGGRHSSR